MTFLLLLAAIAAPLANVIVRRVPTPAARNRPGGGPPLERHYRRLLAWYPAEHRQVHGEEMIGVLMAGAPPGRSRPGLAQAVDLMSGGVRIRLRPGRALSDRDGWGDALAVFSLTAPVLAAGSVSLSYWADQKWADSPGLAASLTYLVLYGQLLVAPLVLLRLRRVAVMTASAQVLAVAVLTLLAAGSTFYRPGIAITQSAALAAVSLAEIAALLASTGQRRRMPLLKVSQWVYVAAAMVPAAVLMPTLFVYWRMSGYPAGGRNAGSLTLVTGAAAAALLLLLAGLWLSSAGGKRLTVLFAALAYPCLLAPAVTAYGVNWAPPVGLLASTPIALIGGTIAVTAVRSGRSRAADDSPPCADQQHGRPDGGQVA